MSAQQRSFMFEFVRAIHEVFRVESTWGFALVIALIFGLVGGGVGYLVDRAYKNAAAPGLASPAITQPIPEPPSILVGPK